MTVFYIFDIRMNYKKRGIMFGSHEKFCRLNLFASIYNEAVNLFFYNAAEKNIDKFIFGEPIQPCEITVDSEIDEGEKPVLPETDNMNTDDLYCMSSVCVWGRIRDEDRWCREAPLFPRLFFRMLHDIDDKYVNKKGFPMSFFGFKCYVKCELGMLNNNCLYLKIENLDEIREKLTKWKVVSKMYTKWLVPRIKPMLNNGVSDGLG